MRQFFSKFFFLTLAVSMPVCSHAQSAVQVGKGSYAAYTPFYKCKTDGHGGDQSRIMQTRKLYVHERKGESIPTNDWWTNLITEQYSGHLWSYPQFIQTQNDGLDIQWPSYWIDNGTEMKSRSVLKVTGDDFHPVDAVAESWHDWDVEFSMADGNKKMDITMAHGMPFTWMEIENFSPVIQAGNAVFLDAHGQEMSGTVATNRFIVKIGDDLYGVYLPDKSEVSVDRGKVEISELADRRFVVVALLQDISQLSTFADYAYRVPRETTVDWSYNGMGKVKTVWHVSAEDLRTGSEARDVMQGFLPHHYRNGATAAFSFADVAYRTPHGMLKMAAGNDFEVDYDFHGMLPWYAAPTDTQRVKNPFLKDRMLQMIQTYASTAGFGADTYWGGKSLTQMALNMMFAREMGNEELFRACHDKLKDALVNWLTYTPGEDAYFFARYDRWGGLVGYNTSYDSDTFNDHHFHYGYFTLAGALLAMVDDDFRDNYGEMLKLVAKDYANWDRNDHRFPLFRTFDPWAGHSFAGGMGDGNGNGQESSSEAMQGWGGVYLLGVALGDDAMRDAGLFGWVSEARGTAEYWFDRHGDKIDPATFHQGNDENYNIDYTKFTDEKGVPHPYNSNLTCHGVGYWTYFGYNSIFMQGIQWMPISPALDYLSEDKDFAAWDYDKMYQSMSFGGWDKASATKDGFLGNSGGWGNVALSYLQRSNPDSAAVLFDWLWNQDYDNEARTVNTNGITYFVTHSHLSYGDLDWQSYASIPTARVYRKPDGTYVYMAYNPKNTDQDVDFYVNGQKAYTLNAKARQLTVSGQASVAITDIVHTGSEAPDPREQLSMVNIALHRPATCSSYENAGTTVDHLTDGDQTTRWGSAHDDGEYVTVDLGEEAKLYKLRLHWEAAYASQYKIQLSDDGKNFVDSKIVNSDGGYDDILMDEASARYIRILGVKRATSYGISLYELEAYGQLASMTDDDIQGVQISANTDFLQQGRSSQLSAKAYTFGGKWTDINPQWSSADGVITSDGVFTPSIYGTATVAAILKDKNITASKQFPVEEAIRLKTLSAKAPRTEIVTNEKLPITISATDQFGCPTEVQGVTVKVKGQGTYNESDATFSSVATGTDSLFFSKDNVCDTLVITVKNFSDINLALGKPTTASSAENDGMLAPCATDGNISTRWGSAWNGLADADADNQQITVDLQKTYHINKVQLYWQTARAKTYLLQTSLDGKEWNTIREVMLDGNTDPLEDVQTFADTPARYVRIQGETRNLGYGYSLYELQVYGTSEVDTHVNGVRMAPAVKSGIFTLSGKQVSKPTASGVYIVNGKVTVVR